MNISKMMREEINRSGEAASKNVSLNRLYAVALE